MTAALKLVADSVAQMRQTASRALIFHPLNLALYIAFMSAVSRYIYKDSSDAGVLFTTLAGITMAALVSVRWLTSGYIYLAEDFSRNAPAFLQNADVLVTKFGDEVIGAVVIGWVPADSRGKRRKGWNGEVRGWAVRLRYRGKGVGTALLEDAVQEARKKGVESVGFADDHASEFLSPFLPVLHLPNLSTPLWLLEASGGRVGSLRHLSSRFSAWGRRFLLTLSAQIRRGRFGVSTINRSRGESSVRGMRCRPSGITQARGAARRDDRIGLLLGSDFGGGTSQR